VSLVGKWDMADFRTFLDFYIQKKFTTSCKTPKTYSSCKGSGSVKIEDLYEKLENFENSENPLKLYLIGKNARISIKRL
jgi:hypothetical protein